MRAMLSRLGFAAVVVGAAAALPVFLLAVPPARFGAAAVPVGLHACAGIVGIGLLLLLRVHPRAVLAALRQPLAMLPAAIGLCGLLASPLLAAPWRHLLGAADGGLGVVWFFDLALLTAGGLLARRRAPARRLLRDLAALAAASAAALTVLRLDGRSWAPFALRDPLAFYGVFLAVAWRTLLLRPGPAARGVGLLLCGAILAVSRNLTALLLVPPAVAVLALVDRARANGVAVPRLRRRGAALALAAALLPSAAVLLHGAPAPLAVLWRHQVQALAPLPDFLVHPFAIVTGYGWGAGPDPHNPLLAALYAGGLVVFFLAWLYPALLVLRCRPRFLPLACGLAAGLPVLLAIWPLPPAALPFLALAAAGLARIDAAGPVRPAGRAAAAALLAVAVAVAGAAAVWHGLPAAAPIG